MADVPLMNNPMTTAGDVIYGGASGAPTRLAAGTADQVLTMNAGATAPEWADAAAGSSATQSFLGTNSAGGSTEAAVAHTWYVKSFTAPANGIVLSIDVYFATTADGASPVWMTGVWADSSGPTGAPLHASYHGVIGDDTAAGGGGGGPSWKSMPCGLYVSNGTTLWGGVQPSITQTTMYYAAGGSDRTWDHAASLAIGAGFATITNSTKNYSIRFSFLSL